MEEKIPKKYVHYFVGNTYNNEDAAFTVNFIKALSLFLNEFHSESIKTGTVKDYYRGTEPLK